MLNLFKKIIHWLIYILAFIVPFQTRYIFSQGSRDGQLWEYTTISLYGTEILVAIIIVMTAIIHFMDKDIDLHVQGRRMLNVYIPVMIFLVAGAASIFFSDHVLISFIFWLRLAMGYGLAYAIWHAQFSLHRFIQIFLASAVIQSIIGIFQFYTQKIEAFKYLGVSEKLPYVSGISIIQEEGARFLRAYGTLGHPNILGGFLLIALIFALGLLFTYKTEKEKILILISIVIVSAGMFFTFSRMAFISTMISLTMVALYLFANKNKGLLRQFFHGVGVFAVVALVLSLIHSDLIFTRYSPQNINSPSFTERVDQVGEAREVIKSSMPRGLGIGSYSVDREPVHNVYLLVLAEMGIGGFIVWIWLIYEILKNILRLKVTYTAELLAELEKYQNKDMYEQEYGYTTHWYICLSSLLVAFFVWFVFDHYFWTLPVGVMMFWMVAGLWMKQFSRLKR